MSADFRPSFVSRRRLLRIGGAALAFGAVLPGLAACGSAPAAPTQAPAAPKAAAEPTKPAPAAAQPAGTKSSKITFANDWNSGTRMETVKFAISEFQKVSPSVTVEALHMGSGAGTSSQGGLFETVVAQFVAGQAPDIVFGWPEMVPLFNRYLSDLTPLWRDKKGDDLGITDHPPITHFEGKRMAIDFAPSISGWYLNTTMVEKAGLPLPREDWDWNDQLDLAKRLTTSDGKQWGIWFRKSWDLDIWQYVQPNLKNPMSIYADKEETKVGYDTPEGLQAFQWFIDLIYKHKVAANPAAASAMKSAETGDLFLLGLSAMTAAHYQSTGDANRFIKDRFQWKLMPPPTPPGKKAWHMGHCEPCAASRDGEKKGNLEPSYDFMAFLSGNEMIQNYIAQPTNRPTVPVKKSVLGSAVYLQAPPHNQAQIGKQAADAANAFNPRHPKKYWAEWMQTVTAEADKAMIGEAPADVAWKSLIEKTQKVIDANK